MSEPYTPAMIARMLRDVPTARLATMLAKAAQAHAPDTGEIMLTVSFNPPDKRRRDLDGMFSNVKAGLDGIADVLAADDYRFAFTIRRAEPIKGGAVTIQIGEGS